jgi:hypothetical protein
VEKIMNDPVHDDGYHEDKYLWILIQAWNSSVAFGGTNCQMLGIAFCTPCKDTVKFYYGSDLHVYNDSKNCVCNSGSRETPFQRPFFHL